MRTCLFSLVLSLTATMALGQVSELNHIKSSSFDELRITFQNPPLANKSRPLWFWNQVPNAEETRSQIKALAEIGYAGLGILPAFPQEEMKFMSPEFLKQYKAAADAAKEFGLKLCLYDEYWFPSGSAGGLLKEKHPEHLCKRLDWVQAVPDADGNVALTIPHGTLMGCVEMNMKTFARRNITASAKEGMLVWQQPAGDSDPYTIMAFVCILDGERNLVDYLEPASVRVFIDLTYAAYQRAMPEHFGTTIDSAFYDEPMLYTPGAGRTWTPRFNEYFEKRFGYDPIPLYPAMFMNIGPDTSSARNALFGFRATLFSEGFVKTIADWLKPYNMPLMGHVDQEEVVNPVGVSGDTIKFFTYQPIAGLDQIFQYGRGSCMYKLISSAAMNYDRHLVMTEVYGGIQDMPVANLYKEAMDQAAKGVNMFVPHAVWYNADPQSVMFQPELSHRTQPFAAELPKYNEYIGRIHTLLQQPGTTVADIAILYPIESLQTTYHFGGPLEAYIGGVPSDDDNYMRLGEYLSLELRRDFFYLHPETLQKNCSVVPGGNGTPTLLRLNNKNNPVEFRTLILPSMEAIGLDTLRRVREFQQAGGNVIAVGRLPHQAAEQGKDAEVTAMLETIFGEEALKTDKDFRQLDRQTETASAEVSIRRTDNSMESTASWIFTDPALPLNHSDLFFRKALQAGDVIFSHEDGLIGTPTGSVMALHRIIHGRDVYFFSNSTEKSIGMNVTLRMQNSKSHQFEWWNPHDGSITETSPFTYPSDNTVMMRIDMEPVNSRFLIGTPKQ